MTLNFRTAQKTAPLPRTLRRFANVVRGVFQACHLGYGVARRHEGKGLMYEALDAGIRYAFGPLDFHRVMANYMPRN